MKRNLRINISGRLFNIDEDAYQELNQYLTRLKTHFGNSESAHEIMADIESRISEMFQEKHENSESVIDNLRVQEAIKAMGEPGEIDDENEEKSSAPKFENTTYYGKRRVYRDGDNKVVGGVSSGLAAYFNIDPLWLRLAFVVLTFSGMSILVYIILWIVIPEAKTTAQKLEMRGEPINLENIEKSIKDELNDLGERADQFKNKHFTKKKGELTVFERLAQLIVQIVMGILRFAGILIGIIFAFIAFILFLALIPILFSGGWLWLNNIPGLNFMSMPSVMGLIMTDPQDIKLFIIGLSLVILIPLIGLIYQGIKLIFGIRHRNKPLHLGMLAVWLVGISLLVYSLGQTGDAFNKKAKIEHKTLLPDFQGDTIFIELTNSNEKTRPLPIMNSYYGQYLFASDETNFYLNPEIEIEYIDSNENAMIIYESMANEKNLALAKEKLDHISYQYNFNDSLLKLSKYFQWPLADKYRGQQIKIILQIPHGKEIKFLDQPKYYNDYELKQIKEQLIEEQNFENMVFFNGESNHMIIVNDEIIEIIDSEVEIDSLP